MFDLPEELSQIHITFHVTQLRTFVLDGDALLSQDDIQVDERMNNVEWLVAILERKVKVMSSKEAPLVKVLWQHQRGSEWTNEPEAKMREHYLYLFTATSFEDEALSKWG